MIKFLISSLLLLSSSCFALEHSWVTLDKNESIIVRADTNSIHIISDGGVGLFRGDFNPDYSNEIGAIETWYEVICSSKKYRILSHISYDKDEKIIQSGNSIQSFRDLKEGVYANEIVKFLCDKL